MIDLRSDTVTRPTKEMLDAMYQAELGDDVYGDDPTVNRFEEIAADLLGTEAAMFVPSGTQSNLVALLVHCQRGDEYIVGGDAHTYKYEGGGAAVLGGIQPQPIGFGEDGMIDLALVSAHIKADDFHFARTRLLALENTQHGRVVPLDYLASARKLVDQKGLALHLDGARVFNAAVKLDVPVSQIARHFDSVSVCLSKGLGAPVGSVLCASKDFIAEARRWRKITGGGMRQAGILAAAGIVALESSVHDLAQDHENALRLAEGLDAITEVNIKHDWTQTNMVWAEFSAPAGKALAKFASDQGMLISPDDSGACRFVTHRDVSTEDMLECARIVSEYFRQ